MPERGIHRTICIGLGGTGRDVLMRIRRLIVDRYGDLTNLPIVSFVHIDTDKGAAQISGLRTGSIYHGVDLRFRESEKINATMSATQVTTFVKGLERRSSDERSSPYHHISSWFPKQLLRNIKAVEEGAKGIRPVGRLAFFQNYEKIKAALTEADKRTRGHEASLIQQGGKVPEGLHIFVVGSLCGGTGSGMFLDVAYTLRKSFSRKKVQIVGYLVIEPKLYGNTSSMRANTYAALKELNHYTTPSTKFEACYQRQERERVEEQRPPFDYTYLVSGETAGDYKIYETRKLCNVIAQKISLGFYSELETNLQSTRDNFNQAMLLQQDNHPRRNVQGYLTFGLAAIYFPRETILQMALNRISRRLGDFWLKGDGRQQEAEFLLDRFLRNWYDDLANKDGFKSKLEAATILNNKTFTNTLNPWKNRLERKIYQCEKKKDVRQALLQQLRTELRKQFTTTAPGKTEANRGVWLTRLEESAKGVRKQFKENIDNFLDQLLTPGNPDFSLRSSRSWLEALTTELNRSRLNLEEHLQSFGGNRSLEDLDKKCQYAQQTIQDIEEQFNLPFLNRKHSQVQEAMRRLVREGKKLIEHNFDFAVAREGLEIVKALQQQVQERVTQAASFSGLVENLKSYYNKQEELQQEINQDELSGEAIFEEKDIEEYTNALLSDIDSLKSVSAQITAALGRGNSLGGFVYRDTPTEERLKEEINLAIDRYFGSRGTNMVQSVIKRFMAKYNNIDKAEALLKTILQQDSQPLLDLNLDDAYYRNDAGKKMFCVGFKDREEQEVKQFKKLLQENLTVKDDQIKPIQEEEEILFVHEYAGFPLRLIDGLEDMREIYTTAQKSGAFLHNDDTIPLGDIIPPDADEMEDLEEIFYPVLALGKREKVRLKFDIKDELRGTTETVIFSENWGQALEKIAERKDISDALKQMLALVENNIEQKPQLWKDYYLPTVREFIKEVDSLPENHPNSPYKDHVVGIENGVIENGVIERFRLRMEKKINGKGETQEVIQPPSTPALQAKAEPWEAEPPALPAEEVVEDVNDTPQQQ